MWWSACRVDRFFSLSINWILMKMMRNDYFVIRWKSFAWSNSVYRSFLLLLYLCVLFCSCKYLLITIFIDMYYGGKKLTTVRDNKVCSSSLELWMCMFILWSAADRKSRLCMCVVCACALSWLLYDRIFGFRLSCCQWVVAYTSCTHCCALGQRISGNRLIYHQYHQFVTIY